MTDSTITVTSTDDLALHVRRVGDARGPTVVLVHGYPDSGEVWRGVATHLADRFHVVVPDVRGAGRSDAPHDTSGYAITQLAADIRSIADATSPDDPIHLVGHDWGAVQSWEAVGGDALAGRLASYTSLSGPCLDHTAEWLRTAPTGDRLRQTAKSWYVAAFHTPLAEVPWRPGIERRWSASLERMEGIVGHEAPATMARDGRNGLELYRANIRERARSPRQRTTDVPVQLVIAEADRFVSPAMADSARPHCSNLLRRSVPDGHWGLLLRRPEAFADLIARFVDDVEAGRNAETD